jgi:GrpB-like predicted nucleotidyltransferase (UPF0157 family)
VTASERDAYLDGVLVGGRERREIVIADYDPAWPARFEAERERIVRALGDQVLGIEHIGSTSVPGLAAKPIVDVLVTVTDPDDEVAFREQLERAGYELRVREPGHRMFRTPARDVHVHLWADGGPDVERQIVFRDRLRASAAQREAYERLKRELARQEWNDMNEYADAKGPFIDGVVRGD